LNNAKDDCAIQDKLVQSLAFRKAFEGVFRKIAQWFNQKKFPSARPAKPETSL
jgi:hypothetical protein